MVKLVKVPSRALAKKKSSPAEAAESVNREEIEDENRDKLEDESSLPPQEGTASLAEGKAAPPKETAAVEVEESEEVDRDDNEAVNEEESEPPSKVTPEMTTPTEDEDNDEEADGGEEVDTAPAPDAKAKKGGMVKPKEDLADDGAASGDDVDDEVESREDEPAVTPGKRKAKAKSKKEAPPVKKAKSEDKGFCLFVGNLNKSKSFMEIKEALAKFFQENDLKIQNVRVGSSRTFGYVNFSTEEQLQKALMLNGKKVMDQKLRLDKAKIKETPQEAKKSQLNHLSVAGQVKTLFIKGLSEKTTDETLKETFEGAIAARIATDKETRSSKGFGFVDFDSEECCKMAKKSMKYCEIDGNKVTLDFARPQGEGRKRGAGAGNREGVKGRGGGGLKGKPQKKKKEV